MFAGYGHKMSALCSDTAADAQHRAPVGSAASSMTTNHLLRRAVAPAKTRVVRRNPRISTAGRSKTRRRPVVPVSTRAPGEHNQAFRLTLQLRRSGVNMECESHAFAGIPKGCHSTPWQRGRPRPQNARTRVSWSPTLVSLRASGPHASAWLPHSKTCASQNGHRDTKRKQGRIAVRPYTVATAGASRRTAPWERGRPRPQNKRTRAPCSPAGPFPCVPSARAKHAALIRRLPTLSPKPLLDTRAKFGTQHGKHSRHTDYPNEREPIFPKWADARRRAFGQAGRSAKRWRASSLYLRWYPRPALGSSRDTNVPYRRHFAAAVIPESIAGSSKPAPEPTC
ncbi:hypothetical protein HRbin30_01513 [bacterium HR30]|nr:hypothetical protein HRbin30_01513 [bacterium HR30]